MSSEAIDHNAWVRIGGEDDMPGLSLDLTTNDIDDVAFDATFSLARRREQLMGLLAEIRTRRAAGDTGDMTDVVGHLEDRIAALTNIRLAPWTAQIRRPILPA